MKKLYRSLEDNMIAGVCGGLGEYFNIDSTIIRLLFVVATFFTSGAMIFAYLIAMIIIPKRLDVR